MSMPCLAEEGIPGEDSLELGGSSPDHGDRAFQFSAKLLFERRLPLRDSGAGLEDQVAALHVGANVLPAKLGAPVSQLLHLQRVSSDVYGPKHGNVDRHGFDWRASCRLPRWRRARLTLELSA